MSAGEDPRVTASRRAVHRATLNLLSADGIAGVTVDRLAEVSGVSRSTIYRRWPDLSALVISAFDDAVHEQVHTEHVHTGPAPAGRAAPALLVYLRDYARRLNDATYTTVLVTITEWAWRDPAFARKHARSFDPSRSLAMRIVRTGRDAGTFRSDLPVDQAVEDIVAPFFYRRVVQRRSISDAEVRRLYDRLMRQFAP